MILRRMSGRLSAALFAVLSILGVSAVQADYALNMTQGVTPIAHEIFELHMIVLWICVVTGIGVFGVMAYSIMAHRKSKGAVPATFHESTTVEIIWTLVPLIVLIAIAVPATGTLLRLEDAKSNADINIQVTGIQWKWKYNYIDEDVEFISSLAASSRDVIKDPTGKENYLLEVDNEIVVPINKKIRFLFTSDDVIHAWWVPDLAVKQDAPPGFINDSWATITEPGVYRGQCAELCGKDHGFMPIVVRAVEEPEYNSWIASKKADAAAVAASATQSWSQADLMAKGEAIYNTSCAACHGATGAGIPGVFPAMTGSAIATGDINAHRDIVMNGKAGTAMAAYKGQLSDVDIAAVITFERNSFGNTVGDMIQPSEIKSAR